MLRQILYILTLVTLNVNPANLCLVLCTQVCTVYSISCILYSGVYSLLAGKVPPPAWPARSCCCSPRYLCSSVSSVRQIISDVRSGIDWCDRNEEELILLTFIHQIFWKFCFLFSREIQITLFSIYLHSSFLEKKRRKKTDILMDMRYNINSFLSHISSEAVIIISQDASHAGAQIWILPQHLAWQDQAPRAGELLTESLQLENVYSWKCWYCPHFKLSIYTRNKNTRNYLRTACWTMNYFRCLQQHSLLQHTDSLAKCSTFRPEKNLRINQGWRLIEIQFDASAVCVNQEDFLLWLQNFSYKLLEYRWPQATSIRVRKNSIF